MNYVSISETNTYSLNLDYLFNVLEELIEKNKEFLVLTDTVAQGYVYLNY